MISFWTISLSVSRNLRSPLMGKAPFWSGWPTERREEWTFWDCCHNGNCTRVDYKEDRSFTCFLSLDQSSGITIHTGFCSKQGRKPRSRYRYRLHWAVIHSFAVYTNTIYTVRFPNTWPRSDDFPVAWNGRQHHYFMDDRRWSLRLHFLEKEKRLQH